MSITDFSLVLRIHTNYSLKIKVLSWHIYSLLNEDAWEFTSDNLHYVINDLDNALYSIDYNVPVSTQIMA